MNAYPSDVIYQASTARSQELLREALAARRVGSHRSSAPTTRRAVARAPVARSLTVTVDGPGAARDASARAAAMRAGAALDRARLLADARAAAQDAGSMLHDTD